jgi:sodium/proline symporter
MNAAIVSFVVLMVLMVASGTLAVIRKKKTSEDYLVASREVPPWLSALSAVATNNSGFMFIGMIAYTYRLGIEAVWMMVGWILGDLTAWIFVHPKVRRRSEGAGINTLSELLGRRDPADGSTTNRPIVIAAGLITFAFLGIYAAAQLKAGSTALHALFEWDMKVGVLIGAAIVLLYSYAGGIRADIWTDAAQSVVMLVTMALILVMGFREIGGWEALMTNLEGQEPALVSWLPSTMELGFVAYLLGLFGGGFGSIGQPHLMVRYMSIDSIDSIRRAGLWYFTYFVPFFVASVGVGLYARALMPDLAGHPAAQTMSDPTELALPLVTMELLPDVFVGVALAGLFAATVSTADSQIIVCSGAVTQDVQPRWKDSYLASKLATFTIATVALLIALFAPEGVFDLVLIAWSALGASLGPVLVIRLLGWPLSTATALTMMGVAIATVSVWQAVGLDDDVLKILPGLLAASAVYGAARLIARLRA